MPGATLVFDLETRRLAEEVGGWQNIARMGLACAVTLDLGAGEYRRYQEPDAARLIGDLLAADLVVGFNVLRFDYAVLQPYSARSLASLPTVDILEHIQQALGFRLSLAALARATLGVAKLAEGSQAVEWFRAGRLEELFAYCERDVALTRDLYEFGRRHGYLRYFDRRGRPRHAPVRW